MLKIDDLQKKYQDFLKVLKKSLAFYLVKVYVIIRCN